MRLIVLLAVLAVLLALGNSTQELFNGWVRSNLETIVVALAAYTAFSSYSLAKHIEHLQNIIDRLQDLPTK